MFHFLHGPLEKGVEENHGACMPISYDHLDTTIAFSYATYKKIQHNVQHVSISGISTFLPSTSTYLHTYITKCHAEIYIKIAHHFQMSFTSSNSRSSTNFYHVTACTV